MELLLLLLLAAVTWLVLLPSRLAGTVRRHRLAAAAILGVATLGTLLLLQLSHPTQIAQDYAQGDATLRAMLD